MKRMRPLLRKNALDIFLFVLFVCLGALLAQKPPADYAAGLSGAPVRHPAGRPSGKDGKAAVKPSPVPANDYHALEERNIFALNGSYETPGGLKSSLETSYNLIGVLKGKEKKAVFRGNTGDVVFLRTGDKLSDGSVVIDIGRVSVKTQNGKEAKEYRMFDVKTGKGYTAKGER